MNSKFLYRCLALMLAAGLPARAVTVTFTNDTVINSFNTNYDGAEVVVTNCTLTVDGPHSFSNLLVAAGGTLTHTFSSNGTVTVVGLFIDEPHTLIDTNASTLLYAGIPTILLDVTDLTKTITYTNDLDFQFVSPGGSVVQIQRTTNSTIPDGAMVLVSYSSPVSTPAKLNLTVAGAVEIATGGAIKVNGKGYIGSFGTGNGGESGFSPSSGGGGGYGGYGGMSSSNAPGGNAYGSLMQPVDLGSGGGSGLSFSSGLGGAGGGAIRIIAGGSLLNNGVIAANGADGTNSRSGGGSGGSIWLTAQTISGAGTVTANGGVGEPIHGGGGGGGRIVMEADTNSLSGPITAYGGVGARNGGAGTIYTKPTGQLGRVLLDNGDLAGTNTLLQVVNGAEVIVRGRAIGAVNVSQGFGKLFVASNSTITAFSMLVNITSGDTTIESSGSITTDGQGPAFGTGNGSSFPAGPGAYYGGGGGHGGFGGTGGHPNARGGNSFNSTTSPQGSGGPGAGSGSSFPPIGGLGGGGIRLTVNGTLTLNGSISAEGKPGVGGYAGGGAGGSVWLTLGTWTGSGSISANGGDGIMPGGGGGGGGRISITYTSNSYTGTLTAYGGTGTNAGGAGTIYLKANTENFSRVILDNNGNAATNTTFESTLTTDLVIAGKANPQFISSNWALRSLRVGSNSTLTGIVGTSPFNFTISTTGNTTIEEGGVITMDGLGYAAAQGTGPGSHSIPSMRGGGGHGGYGGNNPVIPGAGNAYDLIPAPTQAGSGGGNGSGTFGGPPFGGAGGGVVGLTVGGTLTLNGGITANGRDGDVNSGGGAGGALSITCGTLLGSGSLSANGGAGNGIGGGGGGGRIAINYISSNAFTGTLSASGGNGIVPGGAGTIYTKRQSANVGVLLVNNGGLIGTNTPLSSAFNIPVLPFNLTINDGAAVVPLTPLPLLSNLVIGANATLTLLSNQSNLTITVMKDVHILASGAIAVDGKGFGRGLGPGPGISVSSKGSGGGYGGVGGRSSSGSFGGTNYGSPTQPVDRGSGGGAGANVFFGGSDGGGAIRLTVGGALSVNGRLSANGNAGLQDDSGGGAGGSIWVVANAISGSGPITANGGAGELFGGGGGGGGRIAVYSANDSYSGSVSASGGVGALPSGDGTIVWSTNLPTIQGTVTDTNGQPVAGVILTANLENASTTTGVDGNYELSLVPYSAFTVTPSFGGIFFAPGSRNYAAFFTSATNQNYSMLGSLIPTMTISKQSTNVALNWLAIPGFTYQVYYSTNLADWLPYGAPLVNSNGVVEILVPVDSDPQKFFRVQAGN